MARSVGTPPQHPAAKQPRRAIPASIRLHWNGDPEDVTEMLGIWHAIACAKAGVEIDPVAVVNGRGEGIEVENTPAISAMSRSSSRSSPCFWKEGRWISSVAP